MISGTTSINFSSPVTFRVRSQDQSSLNEFTVFVTQTSSNISYFKKNAVCRLNGVIKVVTDREGEQVTLFRGEDQLQQKGIENREAIFNDLQPDVYVVRIGSSSKTITIEQN